MPPDLEMGAGRVVNAIAFVASAALAAGALRFAWERPLIAAGLLGAALVFAGSRLLARRRLRRLLLSGDVGRVLGRWSRPLDRIPHPATMAPLMTATAFAAYGWIERAREALAAAERGPAWEQALEQRLFVDALLHAFEGEPGASLEQAERLCRLPLPEASAALRERVELLRRAVVALARAFGHASASGDRELLERASELSPLVYWAMRYAAAIVAVDQGAASHACELLASAPPWPAESAFRAFHEEITRAAKSEDPAA